jgi:uncharacterized protein YdeI (YjbR/CyaY-like superfamily)
LEIDYLRMGKKDPRVDAYIQRTAPFAKPILTQVRKLVHRGCHDVQETIKWGAPHFEYHGMLCGMAAFKKHCAVGFWKRQLIFGTGEANGDEPVNWSRRLESVSDLPSERRFISYVRKAAKLNESGTNVPKKPATKRPAPKLPQDLAAALNKNAKAKNTFENFSPSCKREYVEWIVSAKRDETRQKRLKTAIEWLNQGKPHNWRYLK